MKKLLAILILGVYLLSSTELYQLMKLPFLVEHFITHKEKNKDLSFYNFLSMHYDNEDVNDGDQDQDRKLPFKSHQNFTLSTNFTFNPCTITCEIPKSFILLFDSAILYQNTSFRNSFQSAIWQPPKFS